MMRTPSEGVRLESAPLVWICVPLIITDMRKLSHFSRLWLEKMKDVFATFPDNLPNFIKLFFLFFLSVRGKGCKIRVTPRPWGPRESFSWQLSPQGVYSARISCNLSAASFQQNVSRNTRLKWWLTWNVPCRECWKSRLYQISRQLIHGHVVIQNPWKWKYLIIQTKVAIQLITWPRL